MCLEFGMLVIMHAGRDHVVVHILRQTEILAALNDTAHPCRNLMQAQHSDPLSVDGRESGCLRVPVSDGHMAAVFFSLENKISKEEIIERWEKFRGPAQELELPSAPKQFLHYFTEDNRPQPKLDRDLEGGMAVSIGRLRPDTQYDYKFVCLSHNTLRGAAGGALLMAELLAAKGYFD